MIVEDLTKGTDAVIRTLNRIMERAAAGEISSLIILCKTTTDDTLLATSGGLSPLEELGLLEHGKWLVHNTDEE